MDSNSNSNLSLNDVITERDALNNVIETLLQEAAVPANNVNLSTE